MPRGTCIKVQVCAITEAKDIVELVLQQFNTIVRAKGLSGPLCTAYANYELCCVDEHNKEHALESDFRVMELGSCLAKSNFYVRERRTN